MHKVLFLLYSVHTPSANTKALYVYSTSDCFGVVSSCCTIVNEKFQWLFSPGKPAPLKRYVPAITSNLSDYTQNSQATAACL